LISILAVNPKKIKVTNKVKEFQWKCLHNINYTEHRLKKNEFVKRKMPSLPNKRQGNPGLFYQDIDTIFHWTQYRATYR
jgi:hypothetical protein